VRLIDFKILISSEWLVGRVAPLLLTSVLFTTTGCRRDQNQNTSIAIVPATSTTEPPEKASPPAPRRKLMNNDGEFASLIGNYRKLAGQEQGKDDEWVKSFVQAYSPQYTKQEEEHEKERIRKVSQIAERTKNLSDQFRELARNKEMKSLTISVPEPKAKDFLGEATTEFMKRVDAFMERHKDDYFQFASYEFCFPEHELCFFSLKKAGVFPEYVKELKKFSTPYTLDLYRSAKGTPADYGRSMATAIYGIMGYIPPDKIWDSGEPNKIIDIMGSAWQPYNNWKPDWLDLPNIITNKKTFDNGLNLNHAKNNDPKFAITIKLPFETMDKMLSSVDKIWTSKIQEMTDKQMEIGQETHSFPDGTSFVRKYDLNEVKTYMTRFIRRNSIFLIARGNPFKMELSEVHLIVSGMDNDLIQLPFDGDNKQRQ